MKKLRAIYRLIITKNYFLVTCHKHDLMATVEIDADNTEETQDYIMDLMTGIYDEDVDRDYKKLLN